jgi:hypothetical protein
MTLERADRLLTLHCRAPISPNVGSTQPPAYRPPVDAPIYWLFGTVLTGWRDYPETESQNRLLLPFRKLLHRHRGASLQVHGQANTQIKHARAVCRRAFSKG